MFTKYKAIMPNTGYFIIITTVGWVDIFTRLEQKYVIIKVLKYSQQHKGLEIYAYCIMPSHVHMLCKALGGFSLPNTIRDFKKYTSKNIIKTIINYPEKRREWILTYFKNACVYLNQNQTYKVWQDVYHAEMCSSNTFINQKLDYIHNNPVKDKIVKNPEDYIFSSARNYADLDSELEVVILIIF
ncbi:MAG: transposase [Flavobacteriaceae bacterium]|nr:MAG: transposase [Flavobacteriaceae bacterium]